MRRLACTARTLTTSSFLAGFPLIEDDASDNAVAVAQRL